MAGKKGIQAGRAYVTAYLDDSLVGRGLKRMRSSFASAGRSITAVGGGLLAGGAGIAALFIKPIAAASDLQETMSKFDTVFGDRAGPVKQWGDQLAETIGRGKTEVASFLANTQDLLVPLGFDPAAAETMSKQVTGLAYDLASFNNMNDADVVHDLQSALTGSGEVMKKYGVVVSEAAVKQQLLNDGINPKNATEAQKAQARLAIILKGTTAAHGDAEKTAGSWANQQKRLAAKLTEVSETIGSALLPVITPLLAKLSAGVGWVGMMVTKGAGLVKWLFYVAAGMAAAGVAITGLGLVFTVLGSAIGGVITVLGTIAGAVAFLISPLGLVLAALTAGAAAAVYFAKQSGYLATVVDWLKDKFGPLAERVKAAFDVIKDALAAGEIGAAAKVAMAALRLAFAAAIAWIQSQWIDFSSFLASVMISLASQIEGIWSQLTASMVGAIATAASKAFGLLAGIADYLGQKDLALQLNALAFGSNAAGGIAASQNKNRLAEIEGQRQGAQEQLDAKALKDKEKLNDEVDKASQEFNDALFDASKVTAEANAKAAADAAKKPPEPDEGGKPSTPAATAKSAINTAAIVGSQGGADAFLKATQGFGRKITPGEAAIVAATKENTEAIKDMSENGVVLAEGTTR